MLQMLCIGPVSQSDRITEINTFILKHEIYLSDGDQKLVNAYLDKLSEVVRLMKSEPAETATQFSETREPPRSATTYVEAYELREQLKDRIRAVLQHL
jgi:hypothetical protein